MALTDTRIRNTKATGKTQKLTDGHGLYLEVTATGSRLWRWRFVLDGKESTLALGRYPDLSLAQARTGRDEARKLVAAGVNPVAHKRAVRDERMTANRNTFESVALEWLESKKKKGLVPATVTKCERALIAHVFPVVGKKPINNITAAELLAIMRAIESAGSPYNATFLIQCCSAVFRYAVVTLRADSDPAALLRGAIARPKVKHKTPLSRDGLALFYSRLADYGGHPSTRIALELLALMFVRTVELRFARWDEFDFTALVWNIPASRMKCREKHVVPLSVQTVALLDQLRLFSGASPYLFPNSWGGVMGRTTLNAALNRMGLAWGTETDFTCHGFRATASTLLNEMGYRPDLIERQLAHRESNAVRRAYNHAQFMPERVGMMQAWADYLDTVKSGSVNVVPLRAGVRNG